MRFIPSFHNLKGLCKSTYCISQSQRFLSLTPTASGNKKYWILQYKYNPDNLIERRAPFRPQHLALAKEYVAQGKLILGGAFAEPIDGAMLIFKGDKAEVEEFVNKDPYIQGRIATEPIIREWTVVVGSILSDSK